LRAAPAQEGLARGGLIGRKEEEGPKSRALYVMAEKLLYHSRRRSLLSEGASTSESRRRKREGRKYLIRETRLTVHTTERGN